MKEKSWRLALASPFKDISFGLIGNLDAGIVEVGSDVTAPVPQLRRK